MPFFILGLLVLILGAGVVTVSQSRPVKNNNPGDLRGNGSTQWRGQVGIDDKNFVIFDTVENGMRAATIAAIHYFTNDGIKTLTQFGNRWAPPSDNAGDSTYGLHLAQRIGVNPDEPFNYTDPAMIRALMQAIFKNEDFANPADFDETTIALAVADATSQTGLA